MNFNVLYRFLEEGVNGFNLLWEPENYSYFALTAPPDMIFSGDETIKSDILMHWISWFCQAMCNVENLDPNIEKHQVFSLVRRGLGNFQLNFNSQQFDKISLLITNLLFNQLSLQRHRLRLGLTKRKKEEILAVYSDDVRCWICRNTFSKNAIERFIGYKTIINLPTYVDVFTPRGITERDLLIEVEHKIPFSKGGGDLNDVSNIALSCGWCNRFKTNFLSLYDTKFVPSYYSHYLLGKISIPQPYWAIRKLAYQAKCNESGCNCTNSLLIQPINIHGGANPLNLIVTCKRHDKFSNFRKVPNACYKKRLSKQLINFW